MSEIRRTIHIHHHHKDGICCMCGHVSGEPENE